MDDLFMGLIHMRYDDEVTPKEVLDFFLAKDDYGKGHGREMLVYAYELFAKARTMATGMTTF